MLDSSLENIENAPKSLISNNILAGWLSPTSMARVLTVKPLITLSKIFVSTAGLANSSAMAAWIIGDSAPFIVPTERC
jgi:hypothetical protein